MPIEKPSPDDIWNGSISFVSIDTNVLKAKGFQFDKGALNQLPNQLPDDVHLVFTQVVREEVKKHRLAPIIANVDQLVSASKALSRQTGINLDGVDQAFDSLHLVQAAGAKFDQELHNYAARGGGSILPWDNVSAADLFQDYFAQKPPFEEGKKSEFPDAAALQMLQDYALDHDTMGIIVSDDSGWASYAERSDRLYHFQNLDELTALFVATGKSAAEVEAKIREQLADSTSSLSKAVHEAIEEHVAMDAEWDTSGFVPDVGDRMEMDVYDATMNSMALGEDIEIWRESEDDKAWVVQLNAKVDVEVTANVEVYKWDSVDREEILLTSERALLARSVDVSFYLRLTDVRLDVDPEKWTIDVDIDTNEHHLGHSRYIVF